jgi:hypothetical protein
METWTHNPKQIKRRRFSEAHQSLQLLNPQRANKRTHLFAKLTTCQCNTHSFANLVHRQRPQTSYWVITCHGGPAVKLAADSSNFEVRHSDSETRGLCVGNTVRQLPHQAPARGNIIPNPQLKASRVDTCGDVRCGDCVRLRATCCITSRCAP